MITDDAAGHEWLRHTAEQVTDHDNVYDLPPSDLDRSTATSDLIRTLSFKPIGRGRNRTRPGHWAAAILLHSLRCCTGAWVTQLAQLLADLEQSKDAPASQWAAHLRTWEDFRASQWPRITARCASPSASVRLGTQDALAAEIYYLHVRTCRDEHTAEPSPAWTWATLALPNA